MKLYPLQTNFARGELSPLMYGRVDWVGYANGVKRMENFHTIPQGGAIRSPGTQYIAACQSNDDRARGIPFVISPTLVFSLIFGNQSLRFIKDTTLVTSGPPYQITTPYTLADLAQLQVRQYGTVMIFTHPNYFPRRLRRLSDTQWVLDDLPISIPALAEQGHKYTVTATLSALTGTITLTAGGAVFGAAKDVGRYIVAGTGFGQITAVPAGNQATVQVLSAFDSLNYASGQWTELDSPLTDITPSGKSLGDIITLTAGAGTWFGSGGAAGENDVGKYVFINNGIVKITSLTSATVANGTVVKALDTTDKAFGGGWTLKSDAWSSTNGYPKTLAIQEGRLIFGGSNTFPTTIWASEVNNILNIGGIGLADSDPYEWVLSSDRLDEIVNMKEGKRLAVFTYGSEYIFSASDGGAVVPTDIQVSRQSSNGSAAVNPLNVGTDVLFVQRLGTKLRAMSYVTEQDAYDSPTISTASEHLFRSGIKTMTYSSEPYQIVWLVTNDGDMVSLCVDREQQTYGYGQRTTQGRFLDAWSAPVNGQDRIFVIVARTVGGVDQRYVEFFDYDTNTDSAIKQTFGSPTSSIAGYTHLVGLTVDVYADGVVFDEEVVSGGGGFTLSSGVEELEAGLPYDSTITMLPAEINLNGTAQMRSVNISNVALRLSETKAIKVNGSPIPFRRMNTPLLNQPLESFTGDKEVTTVAGWERGQPEITIVQDQPLPATITAIRRVFDIHD